MATAGRGAAKLSCVAIGTLREWAPWATCRFWDPEQLQTVLFNAHSGDNLTPAETTAPQGLCHACAMQQCRKRQHLRPLRPTVSWHLATMRVHLGMPPEKGGAGLENPSMYQMYALCQPAPPFVWRRLAIRSRFHGGRCVGIFGSAGLVHTGFRARTVRHLYGWRCYLSCTEHCHEHIGLPFPARTVRSGQR